MARSPKLEAGRAASLSARETAEMRVKVAKANLAAAQADLALSEVRAPIDGQVLTIYTRAGERVGPEGIAMLGRTDELYAIADGVRDGHRTRARGAARAQR